MGFWFGIRSFGRMAALGEDWRDKARYASLLRADRSIFAWEWLRRDADYRAAARAEGAGSEARGPSLGAPARWGLHLFEDPHLQAPLARPMWTARADPFVLNVAASPSEPGPDAFCPRDFPGLVSRLEAMDGREHLLISDGLRAIRLDVVEGHMGRGAALFRYMPAGIRSAELPLLSLRRLLALCRRRDFSGPLFSPETRAWRWILELRVHDALRAGASQREMAEELFLAGSNLQRWRIAAPTVRLQVQRLVRRARIMGEGGYRAFFNPSRSLKVDRVLIP